MGGLLHSVQSSLNQPTHQSTYTGHLLQVL